MNELRRGDNAEPMWQRGPRRRNGVSEAEVREEGIADVVAACCSRPDEVSGAAFSGEIRAVTRRSEMSRSG